MSKRKPKSCAKKRSRHQCALCFSNILDEYRFGKMRSTGKIHIHFNCALFASGLAQNGRKDRGVEGFLLKDILEEVKRASRLKCSYCKVKGASIGCCIKKCTKMFHLGCGQEKGALNQHFAQFASYCRDHKPKQKIAGLHDKFCCICYMNFETKDDVLMAPCCTKGFFHRSCIQKFALSAGYFFKCPYCNCKESFREEMLILGIFIPDQDASWEREENAYHELLIRPECGATKCICPEGRKAILDDDLWDVIYCSCCGSTGRHYACENLDISVQRWVCSECAVIEAQLKQQKETDEKKYVDVEGSDDSDSESEFVIVDDDCLLTDANTSLNSDLDGDEDAMNHVQTEETFILEDSGPSSMNNMPSDDEINDEPVSNASSGLDSSDSIYNDENTNDFSVSSEGRERHSIAVSPVIVNLKNDLINTIIKNCEVPLIDISSGILNDNWGLKRYKTEQISKAFDAVCDESSHSLINVPQSSIANLFSGVYGKSTGVSTEHFDEVKKLRKSIGESSNALNSSKANKKKTKKKKMPDKNMRTLFDLNFFTSCSSQTRFQ